MIEPDPQDHWLGIKAWEVCPEWLPEDKQNAAGELIKSEVCTFYGNYRLLR